MTIKSGHLPLEVLLSFHADWTPMQWVVFCYDQIYFPMSLVEES